MLLNGNLEKNFLFNYQFCVELSRTKLQRRAQSKNNRNSEIVCHVVICRYHTPSCGSDFLHGPDFSLCEQESRVCSRGNVQQVKIPCVNDAFVFSDAGPKSTKCLTTI